MGIGLGDTGRSAFEEVDEGCRRDDNCDEDIQEVDAAAREDKIEGDDELEELRMDSKC